MKLGELIDAKALVPQLESVKRDEVITELVDALTESGSLDKKLRDEIYKQIVATIGVSSRGVDFNALDKAPVYSVVLLISPVDEPDLHLQAMENIFRNLQKDTFRRFLRQATTEKEILDLIEEADTHQLQS